MAVSVCYQTRQIRARSTKGDRTRRKSYRARILGLHSTRRLAQSGTVQKNSDIRMRTMRQKPHTVYRKLYRVRRAFGANTEYVYDIPVGTRAQRLYFRRYRQDSARDIGIYRTGGRYHRGREEQTRRGRRKICHARTEDITRRDGRYHRTVGRLPTNGRVGSLIVRVVTLGCKVNQVESAEIIEALNNDKELCINASAGLEPADVYVLNTCSVTAEADRKSRQYISKMQKLSDRKSTRLNSSH